ncbi:hypothetical protein GCM10027612_59480 [Microbispora bryophytorum subsp. camponoti]
MVDSAAPIGRRAGLRRTLATALAGVVTAALATVTFSATAAQAADCSSGYVGLTYDDGPNPSNTTNLLNTLRSNGLRATFFNIGQNAQNNPSLVRAQVDAGMWVGNHSWTHPHLTQMSSSQIQSELQRTQQAIQQATGTAPKLFRPHTAKPTPHSSQSNNNSDSERSSGTSTPKTGTAPAPHKSSKPPAASRTAKSSSCTTNTPQPSKPSHKSPPTSAAATSAPA